MLPLLEGNVVAAASNLLAPQPVQVDLKPLEEAISRLQTDQRALAFHTTEQKRALRRIQDEFDTLQEAVQKHAEQQAELTEHVAKLAKRTASFNRLVVILLAVLILFTAFLCVRIAYIIRF
jgi:chromosome segregation ATPase